jgi:hypothetical protein
MIRLPHLLGVGLLVGLALVPTPVRPAGSYDSCTGFIDSLPATISTAGNWCLRGHRYTSIIAGAAITIAANHVTVDCNDFRVSGLGAGAATAAVGIDTGLPGMGPPLRHVVVRNCRVQGFWTGIRVRGPANRVERNHIDASTFTGLHVIGAESGFIVVRGNRITDTGGRPLQTEAFGIDAVRARIEDNTVSGVVPAGANGARSPTGIRVSTGLVQRNRITGLVASDGGRATGVQATVNAEVRDNEILQAVATAGAGGQGDAGSAVICRDNTVQRYSEGVAANCPGTGNLHQPEEFP